ncbi:CP2 transcription factor-domain-containing protein [Pilobolus umbonatus]|nr:CP2 transcription factor-domain-containing protein [Pilobolus umbonatus]
MDSMNVSSYFTQSNPNSHFCTNKQSHLRFDVSLEAPTAAAQKIDELPLTYLNKGQYYHVLFKDNSEREEDVVSTIAVTFHDLSYRSGASNFWKYWKSQQKEPHNAKAVEIDITKSNGAQLIEFEKFDRISFRWNGKQGASVYLRFNCLSTDFSRIKGVKGIPLRLQIENQSTETSVVERTYCRIKLFRDKGAERKNKDDAKHIERQLEKIRGKNGESHPLWLAFSSTLPITQFREIDYTMEDNNNNSLLHSRHLDAGQSEQYSILNSMQLPLPSIPSLKKSMPHLSPNEYHNLYSQLNGFPLDIDPTYLPQKRQRKAEVCIFAKYESSVEHKAVYLYHLTLEHFIQKMTDSFGFMKPISQVIRVITSSKDNKEINVAVDDEVIQDIREEETMQVESKDSEDKTSIILILRY